MAAPQVQPDFDPLAALRTTAGVRPHVVPLTDAQRAAGYRRALDGEVALAWAAARPPATCRRLYAWRPLAGLDPGTRPGRRPGAVYRLRCRLADWRPAACPAVTLWRLLGRPGGVRVGVE